MKLLQNSLQKTCDKLVISLQQACKRLAKIQTTEPTEISWGLTAFH